MRPQVKVEKAGSYSGHTDCIYNICKGITATEFYTTGGDGMVVKWDLQIPDQGFLVTKLENSVYAFTLIAEKNLLVICENQIGIRLIDLINNQEVGNIPLPGHVFFDAKVYGTILIVASHTGKILIIDLNSFKLLKTLDHSDKSPRSISIDASKQHLAVGYSDHQIRIFDLEDFDLRFTLSAHHNSIFTLRYDLNGEYLISGGRDAQIICWDTKAAYQLVKTIPAHLFTINDLQFSEDYRYFASCSMDKSIKIWDANTLSLLKVIDKSRHAGHGTSVNKLLWINGLLVSVSDDRKVSVWKIDID